LAVKKQEPLNLAQEGLEAVRNIRDRDSESFYNLSDGSYGLTTVNNIWELNNDETEIIDEFTRIITLSTESPDIKQVTVSIGWQQNLQREGELQISSVLTNWQGLDDVLPTTWQNPILSASLNTPNSANGTKVQVQGNFAYIVTASGSQNFLVFDISNPAITLTSRLTQSIWHAEQYFC
jgi:hypothetical protein